MILAAWGCYVKLIAAKVCVRLMFFSLLLLFGVLAWVSRVSVRFGDWLMTSASHSSTLHDPHTTPMVINPLKALSAHSSSTCVCVCVRACVRAHVRTCVRACG